MYGTSLFLQEVETLILLFMSEEDRAEPWREALKNEMPELEFRLYPDETGDPGEIEYAFPARQPTKRAFRPATTAVRTPSGRALLQTCPPVVAERQSTAPAGFRALSVKFPFPSP